MPASAEHLSALLGGPVSTEQATYATQLCTSMVSGYTRGVGFDDNGEPVSEDLEAVIVSMVLRYLNNPTNVESEGMGALTVRYGTNFTGPTILEKYVMDRYRKTAG